MLAQGGRQRNVEVFNEGVGLCSRKQFHGAVRRGRTPHVVVVDCTRPEAGGEATARRQWFSDGRGSFGFQTAKRVHVRVGGRCVSDYFPDAVRVDRIARCGVENMARLVIALRTAFNAFLCFVMRSRYGRLSIIMAHCKTLQNQSNSTIMFHLQPSLRPKTLSVNIPK